MRKKLAIKGHATRGKEIIELLKMLGGRDSGYGGLGVQYYYYISQFGNIEGSSDPYEFNTYIVFTLEEFLEKYPYKVGDKIPDVWGNSCTVKSMSWDENYKTVMYGFEETIFVVRGDDLYMTNIINNHTKPSKMKNVLAELLEHIKTTPKEDLEREFEEIAEWTNVGPTVEEFMTFCECVNKKPTYPKLKNLTECKEILGEKDMYQSVSGYKGELLTIFQRLLIFRDAYWKIAGEEMGLGKSWEPDWNNSTSKHTIVVIGNDLLEHYTFLQNCILAFPTEEMRDAFYENFKDLIEQCKELL